jgi:stress response protein YsnF
LIADPAGADGPLEVTRHEERVTVGVTRTPHRVVRVRRRIVTEVRLIEVELRSEVLDIDWHEADPSDPSQADDSGVEPQRLEFVLHAEEPEVRLVTVARERIILNRVTVPGTEEVEAAVRSERISVDPGRRP